MADEKEIKRQKLTILQLKDIQTVGDKGAQKLQFKAKDEESKEAWYFTFRTSLFETIQQSVNKVIDCEVQISKREHEGNIYIDRSISQVFIDGQPIAGQKQGGRSYGKSPEELELSKLSYALAYAKDAWVGGKIEHDELDRVYYHFVDLLTAKKSETLKVKPEATFIPTNTDEIIQNINTKPVEAKNEVVEPSAEQGQQKEPESYPQTIQALLNWVSSHGRKYTRTWILQNFDIDDQKMKNNPNECYLEIKEQMGW